MHQNNTEDPNTDLECEMVSSIIHWCYGAQVPILTIGAFLKNKKMTELERAIKEMKRKKKGKRRKSEKTAAGKRQRKDQKNRIYQKRL